MPLRHRRLGQAALRINAQCPGQGDRIEGVGIAHFGGHATGKPTEEVALQE